jgi:signal transduction histidine kinase
MALAVFLTLGSSAIRGGWMWQQEKTSRFEQQLREGEQLVSTMAIPIINALVYEELGIIREGGLLDNFISEIMNNPLLHTRYAFVLGPEGRVLAHNRYAEYGEIYTDKLSREALQANHFKETSRIVDGERISDLAMPLRIAGKSWGSLRVGISEEPVYAALVKVEARIVLFSLLFSGGALLIYWFIGTYLAKPITALTAQMEMIGDSLPKTPGEITYRHDEIGLLQKSFVNMLQRLQDSEAQRQASIRRMIENERISTVGRIVSGVAHEVNNPLAGIEATLYQIERKGGVDVAHYTSLVHQSIERIGRIVGQLSDLSRASEISLREMNSEQFFEDLALFAKMAIKDRGCRLLVENYCRNTAICLDRDKIHQVVLNLVINAADATEAQGSVTLRAFYEEDSYILEVEDDGPGVPAAISDEIFDLFYTTKEPGKGSGIGLTVSKSIVEQHHGRLILSCAQPGALFRVILPQANNGTVSP